MEKLWNKQWVPVVIISPKDGEKKVGDKWWRGGGGDGGEKRPLGSVEGRGGGKSGSCVRVAGDFSARLLLRVGAVDMWIYSRNTVHS